MAAAGFAASRNATAAKRYDEIEARIARRDLKDLYKEDLPTPCMVVDLDLLEKNLKTMADHCRVAVCRILFEPRSLVTRNVTVVA